MCGEREKIRIEEAIYIQDSGTLCAFVTGFIPYERSPRAR